MYNYSIYIINIDIMYNYYSPLVNVGYCYIVYYVGYVL